MMLIDLEESKSEKGKTVTLVSKGDAAGQDALVASLADVLPKCSTANPSSTETSCISSSILDKAKQQFD